jgi:ligand-binding sensor domain-containing protein
MHHRVLIVAVIAMAGIAGTVRAGDQWTNYTDIKEVRSIAMDGQGAIWCASWDTVAKLDGGVWTIYSTPEKGWDYYSATSLTVDRQGAIVCGTLGGVFRLADERWQPLGLGYIIEDVFVDSRNTCWAGSDMGISRYNGSSWEDISMQEINSSTEDWWFYSAFSIDEDNEGVMWFGSTEGPIRYDGTFWDMQPEPGHDNLEFIHYLAADAHGTVWCGTSDGISAFDGTSWKTYTPIGFAGSGITCIAADSCGGVWFGTGSSVGYDGTGVLRYDGVSWKAYTTADGLISNNVNTITVDDNGAIWFGTDEGISKLELDSPVTVAESGGNNNPVTFGINSAYPNPFNPSTAVDFTLPVPGEAALSVYNIAGQLVERVSHEYMDAGTHTVVWNASGHASGLYFILLESEGMRDMRRVLFLK